MAKSRSSRRIKTPSTAKLGFFCSPSHVTINSRQKQQQQQNAEPVFQQGCSFLCKSARTLVSLWLFFHSPPSKKKTHSMNKQPIRQSQITFSECVTRGGGAKGRAPAKRHQVVLQLIQNQKSNPRVARSPLASLSAPICCKVVGRFFFRK